MILEPFTENQLTVDIWIYFWTLSFIPSNSLSIFMPIPHWFDYCTLVVSFEIRKYETSSFFFFIFKSILSIQVHCMNLGSNTILMILNVLIYEHWMSFHSFRPSLISFHNVLQFLLHRSSTC